MRHKNTALILITLSAFAWLIFNPLNPQASQYKMTQGADIMSEKPTDDIYATATFGGGCFWCLESEFRAMDGVLFTAVGYMGGETNDPTYRDITTGRTGHAEVVEITYDPEKISFEELTKFFLNEAHDPTQLNRQGVDVGTQYRSEYSITMMRKNRPRKI